jgi:hypothetical protein
MPGGGGLSDVQTAAWVFWPKCSIGSPTHVSTPDGLCFVESVSPWGDSVQSAIYARMTRLRDTPTSDGGRSPGAAPGTATGNELLVRVTDGEKGQRGYLLTGQRAYLQPCLRAQADAAELSARLRAMTRDSVQVARADSLRMLVGAKFDELAETIEIHDAQGAGAALAVVRTGHAGVVQDGDEREQVAPPFRDREPALHRGTARFGGPWAPRPAGSRSRGGWRSPGRSTLPPPTRRPDRYRAGPRSRPVSLRAGNRRNAMRTALLQFPPLGEIPLPDGLRGGEKRARGSTHPGAVERRGSPGLTPAALSAVRERRCRPPPGREG